MFQNEILCKNTEATNLLLTVKHLKKSQYNRQPSNVTYRENFYKPLVLTRPAKSQPPLS